MAYSAGRLRALLRCQRKGPAADEFGNPVPNGDDWKTYFHVRAGLVPRNGGEAVIAGRLQGRQPYIVTVRQNSNTRMITPEWRLVDDRDPKRVYAVRTVADPDGKRMWLELLVEHGVAA